MSQLRAVTDSPRRQPTVQYSNNRQYCPVLRTGRGTVRLFGNDTLLAWEVSDKPDAPEIARPQSHI